MPGNTAERPEPGNQTEPASRGLPRQRADPELKRRCRAAPPRTSTALATAAGSVLSVPVSAREQAVACCCGGRALRPFVRAGALFVPGSLAVPGLPLLSLVR